MTATDEKWTNPHFDPTHQWTIGEVLDAVERHLDSTMRCTDRPNLTFAHLAWAEDAQVLGEHCIALDTRLDLLKSPTKRRRAIRQALLREPIEKILGP